MPYEWKQLTGLIYDGLLRDYLVIEILFCTLLQSSCYLSTSNMVQTGPTAYRPDRSKQFHLLSHQNIRNSAKRNLLCTLETNYQKNEGQDFKLRNAFSGF